MRLFDQSAAPFLIEGDALSIVHREGGSVFVVGGICSMLIVMFLCRCS